MKGGGPLFDETTMECHFTLLQAGPPAAGVTLGALLQISRACLDHNRFHSDPETSNWSLLPGSSALHTYRYPFIARRHCRSGQKCGNYSVTR